MVAPSIRTSLLDVSGQVPGPCRFLFKQEIEQPSGSFKLRGMSKLVDSSIEKARQNGKRNVHVLTSSGGNAGIAAATASKYHNVPCTVVLPETAKQVSLDILTSLGASIVIHGAHWGEADMYLRDVVMKQFPQDTMAIYCHPFDNEVLWGGHADIIDDLPLQLKKMNITPEKVKGVVCSCGGGGLYVGLVTGLLRNAELAHVPVLVVETDQTAAFSESVEAGHIVTLPKVETLANSLGAPYICEKAWEFYQKHPTFVETMDDWDAVQGCLDYYDEFGDAIEPACGATVATAMGRKDLLRVFGDLASDDVIVFIVCGGSGALKETLEAWRREIAQAQSG